MFQVVGRLAGEIDEVFIDDSTHPMDGAIDGGDLAKFAGLEGNADDALVDHGSGSTTLCDKDFTF